MVLFGDTSFSFTEASKATPNRLGVTGPVRYSSAPRNATPVSQQMYPQGYMSRQPYQGLQAGQQYSNHFHGNYRTNTNFQHWAPGMQQNRGISEDLSLHQNAGMYQNPRMLQSSGLSPGMQQNPVMQRSPGMQQNPSMQTSPSMQQSLGMQPNSSMHQTSGIQRSPSLQISPGIQSSGIQQNPGMQKSPGMQQSFSPPVAANWDQQNYIMAESPPLVSVYGNNQQSQFTTADTPKLSQYQQFPSNTYNYQQAQNTTGAMIQPPNQGYCSGVGQSQQQISPGHQLPVHQGQPGFNTQVSPGYKQDNNQMTVTVRQSAYSYPQTVVSTISQNTQPKPTGFTSGANSQFMGRHNTGNTQMLNAQQTNWQQSSVNMPRPQQYQSSQPGVAGIQAPTSGSAVRPATQRMYTNYRPDISNVAPQPGEREPRKPAPGQHIVNKSLIGANREIINNVRQFNSDTLSQAYVSKAPTGITTPGSGDYLTGMKSPGTEPASQITSNFAGNIQYSRQTNSSFVNQNERVHPNWKANVLPSDKLSSNYMDNGPNNPLQMTGKQPAFIQQRGNMSAQNVHSAAQSNAQWKNNDGLLSKQIPNVTTPISNVKLNEIQSVETAKTSCKALIPPAEGPVSRYYRLKGSIGSTGGALSGDVKSPESQTSQQSTPLSSPVNFSDKPDSALHKLLIEKSLNPLKFQDSYKPPDSSQAASSQKKSSSLTSLLLEEEDSENNLVWQNQNKTEKHNLPTIGQNSFDKSIEMSSCSSLNDSQQDLFADISPGTALSKQINLVNDSINGNDSMSVFSDSMDSKDADELKAGDIRSVSEMVVGQVHGAVNARNIESMKNDLTSLTDLKTFVGSVQKESNYGASYKQADKINISSSQTSGGNIVTNNLGVGPFGNVSAAQLATNQLAHLHSNMMQSPDMVLPKPKRKYTRKNPDLAAIKRSVSVPGIPGLQRKRGRPRKMSVGDPLPHIPNQDIMKQNNFVNYPQQYDLGFQSQQYQQQSYSHQNFSQQQFYPQTNYPNQMPYQEQQFFPQQNQPSFLKELMTENDTFEFQQSLNPSVDTFTNSTNSPVETFTNEKMPLNTSKNSESAVENPDEHDKQFNYLEMHNKAHQEMQAFHKQQQMLSESVVETNKMFHFTPLKEKECLQKKESVTSCEGVSDQKIITNPCSPSAYTFEFKVPTPIFKRLKLRFSSSTRETLSDIRTVQLHPKDARKYSLLKIGSEIIKLHKLSQGNIDKIQEDLILGNEVLGMPPALRTVEIVSTTSDAGLEKGLAETSLQENQKQLAQVCQDGNNINIQRKQKKNRNISSIPHLKKYRAGFPYFGKGNIGKKAPSKQSHPVLSPELLEDNDVVIKDVSLTDASEGVLTPIKARTPVAGRSPAHSSVTVLENESKEYLESKLKELEGDLELNNQTNEQEIFENESDLFDDEKLVDEYEGSTDTDENEEDMETELSKEVSSNRTDLLDNSVKPVGHNELTNTEELKVKQESVLSDAVKQCTEMKVSEMISTQEDRNECQMKNDLVNEFSRNEAEEGQNISKVVALEKPTEIVDNKHPEITDDKTSVKLSDGTEYEKKYKSRSRSNSHESFSSDKCRSRRESSSNSTDIDRNKRLSSIERYSPDLFQKVKGKRKRSSSSNSSRNVKSSKSDDQENKHKKRKSHSKKKKKSANQDSDSDGVPGVDYIVVGRFKGHKEMKVVLHKLDIDDDLESVSAEEVLMTQSKVEKTVTRRKSYPDIETKLTNVPKPSTAAASSKPSTFSGFSAEFEKFLAQSRNEIPLNSDSILTKKEFNQNTMKPHPYSVDSKSSSEDGLSRGESVYQRSSAVENSDGSTNQIGESSSSDMCLSTNHTVTYENLSTFSSKDFLSKVGDKNSKPDIPHAFQYQKSIESVGDKHTKKKKKSSTFHDRMSRAFVGKRKRKHSTKKSSKLMNSLSVLHNATMENLQQPPFNDTWAGPIKLKINLKSLRRSKDFELYSDDVDSDYDTPYCDTMYKLSWYSPPESETGDISPPQPLSPEQLTDSDVSIDYEKSVKTISFHSRRKSNSSNSSTPVKNEKPCFKEDRLNFLNIKKMVNNANLPCMSEKHNLKVERLTLADLQKPVNSANSSEMEGEKHLKEERLTISHIKKVINESTAASNSDSDIDKKGISNLNAPSNIKDKGKSEKGEYKLSEKMDTNKAGHPDFNVTETQNICSEKEDANLEVNKEDRTDNEVRAKNNPSDASVQDTSIENRLRQNILVDLPPLIVTTDEKIKNDENASVHSNESNEENISPPDLGPPIIPRFSPRQYPGLTCRSDPPLLTISQDMSSNDNRRELFTNEPNTVDTPICKRNETDGLLYVPPNLAQCQSPGSNSNTAQLPREHFYKSMNNDVPKISSGHLKTRPGHSPAASSGSINVIHSEEFSDISDDESIDELPCPNSEELQDKSYGIPNLTVTRTNIMNYLQNSSMNGNQRNKEKDAKLKELFDFEKHMNEKDMINDTSLSKESKELDREVLKNNIKEFENRHKYEPVNFSIDDRNRNENHVRNEIRRRHSEPLYNPSCKVSYNNSIIGSKDLSQDIHHTSEITNNRSSSFDSCKFTQIRRENFDVNSANPKYMSIDAASQNGFRSHQFLQRSTLKKTDLEMNDLNRYQSISDRFSQPSMYRRYNSCEESTHYNSPGGIHSNYNDSFRTNNSSNTKASSLNFGMNSEELFSDTTQNKLTLQSYEMDSDSPKSVYNICRSRRISDSIIKSVTNHSLVAKDHDSEIDKLNNLYTNDNSSSDVPFMHLGTGGNKTVKHKQIKQTGKQSDSGSDQTNQQGHDLQGSGRGGGDTGPNGNNRGTDKHGSLQTLGGCQVITPLTSPPTRECIYQSANQFGLSSVQAKEAFFGNPKDVPERPRY